MAPRFVRNFWITGTVWSGTKRKDFGFGPRTRENGDATVHVLVREKGYVAPGISVYLSRYPDGRNEIIVKDDTDDGSVEVFRKVVDGEPEKPAKVKKVDEPVDAWI